MAHSVVPEADEILDTPFPVLNKGFVRLIDYMGSDARIVQAARVSYGEGTKTVREDAGLIDYLLRNDHTSPFEQVVFTFHAKMPIFVARQWIRHRTARVNEISGRYSVMADEFYIPDPVDVAAQSRDNKQGRETEPMAEEKAAMVRKRIEEIQGRTYEAYSALLQEDTARELARVVLPLSLYTEWYWQIDLHNLFRFVELRTDPHAQREIRAYATVVKDLASRVCPLAFASFERHRQGSTTISADERQALLRLVSGKKSGLDTRAEERLYRKLDMDTHSKSAKD